MTDPSGLAPTFTCPICGRTVHSEAAAADGWCATCMDWTRDGVTVLDPRLPDDDTL